MHPAQCAVLCPCCVLCSLKEAVEGLARGLLRSCEQRAVLEAALQGAAGQGSAGSAGAVTSGNSNWSAFGCAGGAGFDGSLQPGPQPSPSSVTACTVTGTAGGTAVASTATGTAAASTAAAMGAPSQATPNEPDAPASPGGESHGSAAAHGAHE